MTISASQMSVAPTQRLQIVQVLRAIAVLCVVISHAAHELTNLLANEYQAFDSKFFPGDFGVDLFFLISGFIMVFSTWEGFQKPGSSANFIIKRLIRIVPLYWAATTLMIAIVIVLPGSVNTATSDIGQWISSYLFWPYARENDGLIRPVLGLGWSLQYEMLFYLLFAFALLLPRVLGLIVLVSIMVIVNLIAAAYVLNNPEAPTFLKFVGHSILLEFGIGVILGYFYMSGVRFNRSIGFILAGFGLLILLLVPAFNDSVDRLRILHYGIPATLILSAAVFSRGVDELSLSKPLVETGEISYSIYLVHPFVVGAVSIIFRRLEIVGVLSPLNIIFIYASIVIILSLLAAYFTHYLYDLPVTNALKRYWFRTKKMVLR